MKHTIKHKILVINSSAPSQPNQASPHATCRQSRVAESSRHCQLTWNTAEPWKDHLSLQGKKTAVAQSTIVHVRSR